MAKIGTPFDWSQKTHERGGRLSLQDIILQVQHEVFGELRHRAIEICLDAAKDKRNAEYASHRIRDLELGDLR